MKHEYDYVKQNARFLIEEDEGFSSKLYRCPKGKLTIGYGFNLEEIDMPLPIANLWLILLIDNLYVKLSNILYFFNHIDDIRKVVLINMAYNLGFEGLLMFKKMLLALENKDYEKAAEEMKNSKWYEQVPNRADRLIKMMITGEFDVS